MKELLLIEGVYAIEVPDEISDPHLYWVKAAYSEYVQLLSEEINELIGIANTHLWKSTRHEKGLELREKIAKLNSSHI